MDTKRNWEKAKMTEIEWLNEKNRWPQSGTGSVFTSDLFYDMKHTGFMLARYKFVAKLLRHVDCLKVMEIGCSEGLGAIMIEQNTDLKMYFGIDMDGDAINWAKNNVVSPKAQFVEGDFLTTQVRDESYDAVYSLDVIEHINPDDEGEFLRKCSNILSDKGTLIIGTPNITMNPFASDSSKIAHINLYDQDRLYKSLSSYFNNVYIFNMNDEIVNVGFDKMACYIIGVACNKKKVGE